jgi:hypothetical protein
MSLLIFYKERQRVVGRRQKVRILENPLGVGLKPTKRKKMYFEMRSAMKYGVLASIPRF